MSTLKDRLNATQVTEAVPQTAAQPQQQPPPNPEQQRFLMVGHYEPRPRRIARDVFSIRPY